MNSSIKVGIFGCTGRVGRRLCVLTELNPDLTLVAAMTSIKNESIGLPLHTVEPLISEECNVIISPPFLEALPNKPDVIIDFSTPEGTISCVQHAAKLGIPMVIGTTGLTKEQETVIETAAELIPIIHAMNFSLGVNLLLEIAATVADALGDEFNIEIVESHHNKKVDAPSGTALALADSICQALGRSRENLVHGRHGQVGKRTFHEIGMHSLRIGGVIGDHSIHFGSEYERIELTHRAQNRDVFVSGALRAGRWLVGRKSGMHSMFDVLFKSTSSTAN